jgi:hypothetical protein
MCSSVAWPSLCAILEKCMKAWQSSSCVLLARLVPARVRLVNQVHWYSGAFMLSRQVRRVIMWFWCSKYVVSLIHDRCMLSAPTGVYPLSIWLTKKESSRGLWCPSQIAKWSSEPLEWFRGWKSSFMMCVKWSSSIDSAIDPHELSPSGGSRWCYQQRAMIWLGMSLETLSAAVCFFFQIQDFSNE